MAQVIFASSEVSAFGGNGNGTIEPNECNLLNVSILNDGRALASNVNAVLSTNTPGVTVTQSNAQYPDIIEGATATNATPFQVSTDPSFVCGTTIDFQLTVNFAGGGCHR